MAPVDPTHILSALARLTGDTGQTTRHTRQFRLEVLASDGVKCAIIFQASEKEAFTSNLRQIADLLRVSRDRINEVLRDWTFDDLQAHLRRFPSEVLNSAAVERRYERFVAPAASIVSVEEIATSDGWAVRYRVQRTDGEEAIATAECGEAAGIAGHAADTPELADRCRTRAVELADVPQCHPARGRARVKMWFDPAGVFLYTYEY